MADPGFPSGGATLVGADAFIFWKGYLDLLVLEIAKKRNILNIRGYLKRNFPAQYSYFA